MGLIGDAMTNSFLHNTLHVLYVSLQNATIESLGKVRFV